MAFLGAAVVGLGGLGAVCEGCVAACVCGGFVTASGVFIAAFVGSVCTLTSPLVVVVCESVAAVCGGPKVTALVFFVAVVVGCFGVFATEETVAAEVEVTVVEVAVFARVFAASL